MKQIHITAKTSRWYGGITKPIDTIREDDEFYYVDPTLFLHPLTGRRLTSEGKILKTDCKEIIPA